MSMQTWVRNLFQPRRRSAPTVRMRPRLMVELLEDRLVPASFIVSDLADNVNDAGSIRFAVNHLAAGSNTVTFDSSLANQTIILTGGALVISQNVTITGLGASQLSISGNNASRVFNVTAAGATVQISGLTLENGLALQTTTINSGQGGAVRNIGNLTLTNVAILNSKAQGQAGSPSNQGGGGGGAGLGGGIYNTGQLQLIGSTLSGNLAVGGAGATGNGNGGPNGSAG